MESSIINIREIYRRVTERCLEPQEISEVVNFTVDNKLDQFTEDLINKIEALIQSVQNGLPLDLEEIKTIGYSILKKFNSSLKPIQSGEEKSAIKKILAKLARGFLAEIHHRSPTYGKEIKKAIAMGMEQAIDVEEYDRKDFERYLQLDYTDIEGKQISIETGKSSATQPKEYLKWNHEKADLRKLVHLLVEDYDCIKSINDFTTLFDNPDSTTKIKWNLKKIDLLILLFDYLYDNGIIEIKRGKGLWKVLVFRMMDFGKNPLPGKFAKRLDKLKVINLSESTAHKELEQIKSTLLRKS